MFRTVYCAFFTAVEVPWLVHANAAGSGGLGCQNRPTPFVPAAPADPAGPVGPAGPVAPVGPSIQPPAVTLVQAGAAVPDGAPQMYSLLWVVSVNRSPGRLPVTLPGAEVPKNFWGTLVVSSDIAGVDPKLEIIGLVPVTAVTLPPPAELGSARCASAVPPT